MNKQYHILNGDALRERFPKDLPGTVIVARECLVDGPVASHSLDKFFRMRADFIADNYGGYQAKEYEYDVVEEFAKITNIPSEASVCLWFEDDLFCQVNCWFVAHLLHEFVPNCQAFLVRPPEHTPYGFGALSKPDLVAALERRLLIPDLCKLASLWKYFQEQNSNELRHLGQELQPTFPFIIPAIEAYVSSIPHGDQPGRPAQILIEIMSDLKTEEFGAVFRAFCRRAPIYGYGDLQVRRLFDQIRNKPLT